MSEPGLRRTPLFELHRHLGARIVEFGGFEMPVQYAGVKQEHAAVRERAGLFDVSHMGQLHFRGPDATATLERLVSCPVASLRDGRVRYGVLCNAEGGAVDDVTLYRQGPDELFLCVNASNIEKDDAWVREHSSGRVEIDNRSDETGLLALQGPASAKILAKLGAGEAGELRYFRFAEMEVDGVPALVSRTGYTGAGGFELYVPGERASALFERLLDVGQGEGIEPAGLGARDTLRLEAALPLYGHELDETTSPLEAGLDRFVKREAGGFIGAEAIERRASAGHPRALAGFVVEGRGIARADYPIAKDGAEIGIVTSGAPSVTLDRAIGLGYLPPQHAKIGDAIDIRIRGKDVPARIVETPFVDKNG